MFKRVCLTWNHCYWIKIYLGRGKYPSYIIYTRDANCREKQTPKDLHLIKSKASHFRSIITMYSSLSHQNCVDLPGDWLPLSRKIHHSPWNPTLPLRRKFTRIIQKRKVVSLHSALSKTFLKLENPRAYFWHHKAVHRKQRTRRNILNLSYSSLRKLSKHRPETNNLELLIIFSQFCSHLITNCWIYFACIKHMRVCFLKDQLYWTLFL